MSRHSKIALYLLCIAFVLGTSPVWAQENQTEPAQGTASNQPIQPLEPGAAVAPVDPKSYVIGAEDLLQILVWREAEVSGSVVVRPDGMITLQLIGEVQAAGRTPNALREEITEKLSQFLNRPEVMVSVTGVRSKKYYITGQVNRTGAFPLVVPTTVLEALSGAGGFQQWANKKNITILRGSQRLKFNYNEVIKGKNPGQDIYLENGDHIIVP